MLTCLMPSQGIEALLPEPATIRLHSERISPNGSFSFASSPMRRECVSGHGIYGPDGGLLRSCAGRSIIGAVSYPGKLRKVTVWEQGCMPDIRICWHLMLILNSALEFGPEQISIVHIPVRRVV